MKRKVFIMSFFVVFSMTFCGCKSTDLGVHRNEGGSKSDNNTDEQKNINKNTDPESTNTYVIDYDFQSGTYNRNRLKLKVNTPTVFKISNINRLAYDATVKAKDSILAETFMFESITSDTSVGNDKTINKNLATVINEDLISGSSIKNNINTISRDDFNLSKLQDNKSKFDANNLLKLVKKIANEETLNNKISKINEEIASNKRDTIIVYEYVIKLKQDSVSLLSMDSRKTQIDSIAKMIDKSQKKNLETKKNIEKLIEDLETQKNQIEISKGELEKFRIENDKIIASFGTLKFHYNNAIKAIDYYNDVMEVADNSKMTLDTYRKKYKSKFDIIFLNLQFIKDDIKKFKEIHTDFEIVYSYFKYNPEINEYFNYGGQIKLYAHAENLKSIADKMNENIKNIDINEMIKKTVHLITFLENNETYNISFAPIQPFNDVALFDVKIVKKEKNCTPLFNNRVFKHHEFTYGGTRIDFSLGLAASYFSNTSVYELGKKDNNSTGTVIRKKGNDFTVPSLIGLVTMSHRMTGYVAYGGSAGLGIDVTNGKIQLSNFFAGATVLFGKYDRLFLTIGPTLRNVGKLKSGYLEGASITNGGAEIQDFLTDDYKVGWFLSLTYNLTKGVRDNAKQLKSFL